ncbi:MAG: hypothetical protein O3C28_19405, partial [Proteobacteria bacterium]|nr:hypothetical protein [Pseudomonadota bacterium]
MSEIHKQAIDDHSAWQVSDLVADRSWEFFLEDDHHSELENALEGVNQRGLQLAQITAADFRLPTLSGLLSRLSSELR